MTLNELVVLLEDLVDDGYGEFEVKLTVEQRTNPLYGVRYRKSTEEIFFED